MPRPIDSLAVFLSHALAIEREAAARYGEFATWFAERGEPALASICEELARAERSHFERLMLASDGVDLEPMRGDQYQWLEPGTPEAPMREAFYRVASPAQLLEVALQAERKARRFFGWVARTTRDRSVRSMAREIATEEAQHVAWIEKAIAYRDPAREAEALVEASRPPGAAPTQ